MQPLLPQQPLLLTCLSKWFAHQYQRRILGSLMPEPGELRATVSVLSLEVMACDKKEL